jgi:hypothetical protein
MERAHSERQHRPEPVALRIAQLIGFGLEQRIQRLLQRLSDELTKLPPVAAARG